MKILIACKQDIGGQGIGLKKAITEHTPHECRVIREENNYINYEKDIETTDLAVWNEMIEWADVVHVQERKKFFHRIRSRKPVVWSLHGSCYRWGQPKQINTLLDGYQIPILVSTLDLQLLRPDATWLPLPLDTNALRRYRDPSKTFLVLQTTTATHKGTIPDHLGEGVVTKIVKGVTHEQALTEKGKAWAVVDQVGRWALGIGSSGLEAMAMGIPVLSQASEGILDHLRHVWGRLPFIPTTPETLLDHVDALRGNPQSRQRWAERGYEHIAKFHTPAKVAGAAIAAYEKALE